MQRKPHHGHSCAISATNHPSGGGVVPRSCACPSGRPRGARGDDGERLLPRNRCGRPSERAANPSLPLPAVIRRPCGPSCRGAEGGGTPRGGQRRHLPPGVRRRGDLPRQHDRPCRGARRLEPATSGLRLAESPRLAMHGPDEAVMRVSPMQLPREPSPSFTDIEGPMGCSSRLRRGVRRAPRRSPALPAHGLREQPATRSTRGDASSSPSSARQGTRRAAAQQASVPSLRTLSRRTWGVRSNGHSPGEPASAPTANVGLAAHRGARSAPRHGPRWVRQLLERESGGAEDDLPGRGHLETGVP